MSPSSLKMAKPTVQKKTIVTCPFCSKPYIRLQALRTHIISKHKEENDRNIARDEEDLNRDDSISKEAAFIQDIFENDIEDNPYKNKNIGMHKKIQERIQKKRSKISYKKCPKCVKGFNCKSRFESCRLCDKIQHSDCILDKAERENLVSVR